MFSLNKVTLIGRLGSDPQTRYTSGGQAVSNFTVATEEEFKDRSGEKQKKTEWHKIVVWGPAAEKFVQPYLHKGDLVFIEGKLQTRQWDDKEGQKRTTTEINAFDIKKAPGGSTGSSNSNSNAAPERSEENTGTISDEDIPF